MATDGSLTFGMLLARYRAALGLTQEELAERAGLSVRGLRDLERGVQTRPRAYTVRQLAQALELMPDDRALFEHAARAAGAARTGDALPVGNFLGALPPSRLMAREEELRLIRSVLDTVAEGAGQLLLVSGEVGAGKTRLMQEVMVEARERTYLVLTGRCYGAEQSSQFYPFLEALDAPDAMVPATLRADWRRGRKRSHALLAASIAETHTASGAVVSPLELPGSLSDLLLLAAQSMPVALLLDDLQWADGASLKLLQHLARATRVAPILLVASFRDARIGEEHPELATVLQTLSRERLAEHITVRRLSLEETTELVAAIMTQQAVSEEFASFVYRRTKGNPRLIDQLVRSLGGRLELQGEIGAGAMGRVFRAFDRRREQTVAAKLVLARSEIDLDTLLRFQQEGAVLAKLDHPNIVQIYDTFAEEHASCIIMELLEGQSLGKIVREGPLPLPRAKAIALQVADALAYAHSQEIVHRDIKPDNVMVLEGDRVKVTDFGIARLLQPDTSLQTIATTGMRMGTPLYMAPEQIEGMKIDGRTDIYALGVMLYHMVTGRPPFKGDDALAVAVKHLREAPVPASDIDPAIPADWDNVMLKAMAKDPARRFQSAREMGMAIAALSEAVGSPPRPINRPRWAAIAAALVVTLVATVAGVWAHAASLSQRPALSSRMDAYLSGLAARGQLSGTVVVARAGTTILSKGYGMADRELRVPNTANTRFAVESLSTIVSLTAAARLEEEGKLSDRAPICTYLAHCPRAWKSITVHQVLAGTSALPPVIWSGATGSEQQSLAACRVLPLNGKVGGRIDYENCGVLVLGAIIQRVAGVPWEQFVRETILRPEGMTQSGRLTDALQPPWRAADYVGSEANSDRINNARLELYSTAPDILKLDDALFAGKLVSHGAVGTMVTPRDIAQPAEPGIRDERWGYFWKVGTIAGRRVFYTATTSESDAFSDVNMRFPRESVTIIVLDNDIGNDAVATAVNLARVAFGERVPPAPPAVRRVQIPAASAIQATIDTHLGVALPAMMPGALWLPNPEIGTLTRIDSRTGSTAATLKVGDPTRRPLSQYSDGDPLSVAAADGQVWTLDAADREVVRVATRSTALATRVRVGVLVSDLAIAQRTLWAIAYRDDLAVRVDLRTNTVAARIPTLHEPIDVAVSAHAVWVSTKAGEVQRIDPLTNRIVASFPVGQDPEALAVGDGSLWVSDRLGDYLSRVDLKTDKVIATIPLAPAPPAYDGPCCRNVAIGEGAVWAIAPGSGELVRIDPKTNRITAALTIPSPPGESHIQPLSVMIGDGSLWVCADPHYVFRIDPSAMK